MENHDEEVKLIKKLISGEKTICPKCGNAYLEHFHMKAKKSNTYYVCPSCKERYQIMKMMDEIS